MPDIKDERAHWPVRLWWLAEDKVPGLLPAERRFWRLVYILRHPRITLADWRKWRSRPRAGDLFAALTDADQRARRLAADVLARLARTPASGGQTPPAYLAAHRARRSMRGAHT